MEAPMPRPPPTTSANILPGRSVAILGGGGRDTARAAGPTLLLGGEANAHEAGGVAKCSGGEVAAEPTFEFWDDHHYEGYGPRQQHLLRAAWRERPRPTEVSLAAGKYVVQKFDEVEYGRSFQVNSQTKHQRHLRLRTPYCTSTSAPEAALPGEEFHFSFWDDVSWQPYGPDMQREFACAARSRPPPQCLYFDVDGRTYQLLGLDTLAAGGGGSSSSTAPEDRTDKGLRQVYLRTGKVREVRISAGMAAEVPQQLSLGRPAPPLQPLAAGAIFRSVMERTGCGGNSSVLLDASPEEHAVLLESWLQAAPPDQVALPGGGKAEGLTKLEVGGTRVLRAPAPAGFLSRLFTPKAMWMPLHLVLPAFQPGSLHLPRDLEEEPSADVLSYGRYLTKEEILSAASLGGSDAVGCAICLCEVEADPSGAEGENLAVELRCGHLYHTECLRHWFREKKRCPKCQRDFGKIIGTQPRVGTLRWSHEAFLLPGHTRSDGSIVLDFEFPPGRDDQQVPYSRRRTRGYLPLNAQGMVLLELFKVAFRRRVMFGLGHSLATEAYRPTFNIHIKTSTSRGAAAHGYPDDTYFFRAMEELHANGVTRADLRP